MQPQLNSIIEGIDPAEKREFIRGVFNDLKRLLGYLDNVRAIIRGGGTCEEAQFVFAALCCEALVATGALDYV